MASFVILSEAKDLYVSLWARCAFYRAAVGLAAFGFFGP